MLTNQILHDNFLLIHQFLYPHQPIKQWVKEDPDYIHHYHNDWNALMEILIKISLLYDSKLSQTIRYLEQAYYLESGMNTIEEFYMACVCEIKQKLSHPETNQEDRQP